MNDATTTPRTTVEVLLRESDLEGSPLTEEQKDMVRDVARALVLGLLPDFSELFANDPDALAGIARDRLPEADRA